MPGARRAKPQQTSGNKRKLLRSSKAVKIVRLVEALTSELDDRGRVLVGRRMVRSLRRAFEGDQRPVPNWVKDVHAYFDHGRRK
jgi:hypothetical protein